MDIQVVVNLAGGVGGGAVLFHLVRQAIQARKSKLPSNGEWADHSEWLKALRHRVTALEAKQENMEADIDNLETDVINLRKQRKLARPPE